MEFENSSLVESADFEVIPRPVQLIQAHLRSSRRKAKLFEASKTSRLAEVKVSRKSKEKSSSKETSSKKTEKKSSTSKSKSHLSANYERYEVLLRKALHDMKAFTRKSETSVKSSKHEESTQIISNLSEQQLLNIIKEPAVTAQDRWRVLNARDSLMRLRSSGNDKKKKIIGQCPDMCPETERYSRITKNCLSTLEMKTTSSSVTSFRDADHRLMVKEYSRSSADQQEPLPHELRPVSVLKFTMDYLICNVMDMQLDSVSIGDWYDFIWNRTRSIRKDITQQQLCDINCVEIIEKCVRFHIHCAEAMSEEDRSVFDPKINNENLTKCLQTLKHMYQDLQSKGIKCVNEAEFRAYDILLSLSEGETLRLVKDIRKDILKSPLVKAAFEAALAFKSHNYVKFFKIISKAPYLSSCILNRYIHEARVHALQLILRSYTTHKSSTPYPVSSLVENLKFENEVEACNFCRLYGLSISDNNVMITRQSFNMVNTDATITRSKDLVGRKMGLSLGLVINNGPLPENPLQYYQPHNSFDDNNFLKSEEFDSEQIKCEEIPVTVVDTKQLERSSSIQHFEESKDIDEPMDFEVSSEAKVAKIKENFDSVDTQKAKDIPERETLEVAEISQQNDSDNINKNKEILITTTSSVPSSQSVKTFSFSFKSDRFQDSLFAKPSKSGFGSTFKFFQNFTTPAITQTLSHVHSSSLDTVKCDPVVKEQDKIPRRTHFELPDKPESPKVTQGLSDFLDKFVQEQTSEKVPDEEARFSADQEESKSSFSDEEDERISEDENFLDSDSNEPQRTEEPIELIDLSEEVCDELMEAHTAQIAEKELEQAQIDNQEIEREKQIALKAIMKWRLFRERKAYRRMCQNCIPSSPWVSMLVNAEYMASGVVNPVSVYKKQCDVTQLAAEKLEKKSMELSGWEPVNPECFSLTKNYLRFPYVYHRDKGKVRFFKLCLVFASYSRNPESMFFKWMKSKFQLSEEYVKSADDVYQKLYSLNQGNLLISVQALHLNTAASKSTYKNFMAGISAMLLCIDDPECVSSFLEEKFDSLFHSNKLMHPYPLFVFCTQSQEIFNDSVNLKYDLNEKKNSWHLSQIGVKFISEEKNYLENTDSLVNAVNWLIDNQKQLSFVEKCTFKDYIEDALSSAFNILYWKASFGGFRTFEMLPQYLIAFYNAVLKHRASVLMSDLLVKLSMSDPVEIFILEPGFYNIDLKYQQECQLLIKEMLLPEFSGDALSVHDLWDYIYRITDKTFSESYMLTLSIKSSLEASGSHINWIDIIRRCANYVMCDKCSKDLKFDENLPLFYVKDELMSVVLDDLWEATVSDMKSTYQKRKYTTIASIVNKKQKIEESSTENPLKQLSFHGSKQDSSNIVSDRIDALFAPLQLAFQKQEKESDDFLNKLSKSVIIDESEQNNQENVDAFSDTINQSIPESVPVSSSKGSTSPEKSTSDSDWRKYLKGWNSNPVPTPSYIEEQLLELQYNIEKNKILEDKLENLLKM